jgi:hypothetical protein
MARNMLVEARKEAVQHRNNIAEVRRLLYRLGNRDEI